MHVTRNFHLNLKVSIYLLCLKTIAYAKRYRLFLALVCTYYWLRGHFSHNTQYNSSGQTYQIVVPISYRK